MAQPKPHVLLLGATGNLGRPLLPTLLPYSSTITVLVRSPQKLALLFSSTILSRVTVVEGDATSQSTVAAALRKYRIDVVVDVAGNQVWPWKEHVLETIVGAVSGAARDVGRERGKGKELRAYLPSLASIQHQGTLKVLEAVPAEELRWSLLCVAIMVLAKTSKEPLEKPRSHNLIIKEGDPPPWKDHWIRNLPFVGGFLNFFATIPGYTTELEDVAAFLAEDAENGSQEWAGKKVGMKQKEKGI